MKYRKKKLLLSWLLILLLFTLSGLLGSYMSKDAPEIIRVEEVNTEEERISPNSRLVTQYEYALCGHVVEDESDMPAAYIGLSKQELREQLDGFSIVIFSPEKVVLKKHFECYCENHVLAYLEEGAVNLYRCEHASDTFELLESTKVDEEALLVETREALLYGKVFSSLAEAREYVEALP